LGDVEVPPPVVPVPTVMVASIWVGWFEQWYGKVPGALNVNW